MGVLAGKVALITGAARGQGEADARLMVQEGARVVVTDVLDDEGRALADELGEASIYQQLDVTRADEWAQAVAATFEAFGRLDVLVNNAGIARLDRIETLSEDEYLAHVKVNQLGPWLGMKAVVDPLKDAGGGAIINIASTAGMRGFAGGTHYCSTKHAVVGMTKAAAYELGPLGIRVNAVCPGGIDTPMNHASVAAAQAVGIDPAAAFAKLPLGRIARPGEIAAMVVFLASDAGSYCTGGAFAVDGGQIAGLGA